jgi:transcriptional regulator with XRE-family HTH domain
VRRFGQTLLELRREAGLSQKRLAPALGVSHTYLSKLESGTAHPSKDLVDRVARYFDYNHDVLLLAADRIPDDIVRILQDRPDEAIALLRRWVSGEFDVPGGVSTAR